MVEPAVTREKAAAHARALVRGIRHASLATLARKLDNLPFVSLVTVACDPDARPLLMLSDLADHARNLKQSSRASLLFADAARRANPQTGPRVTVYGDLAPLPAEQQDAARRRFLARHPAAAMYAGFGDFRMYAMTVEGGRYVGGFARAMTLHADDLILGSIDPDFAAGEAAMLETLASHDGLGDQLATRVLKRRSTGWAIVGIDPEGLDLQRSSGVARIPFDQPAQNLEQARRKTLSMIGGELK